MAPKAKSVKRQDAAGKPSKVSKAGNAPPTQVPRWPPITPTTVPANPSINVLLEDQILTIPRLWSAKLCKQYVEFLSTLELVTTPGKPRRGEAVRVNDRLQVENADFAERLWGETALEDIIQSPTMEGRSPSGPEKSKLWGGEVLGLNSNIRVYRYSEGQFFGQHFDDSNNIMFPSANATRTVPARTTWTLLLYLSSPATGCEGGETVFYPDAPSKREAAPPPIVAELEVGMALLHRHGSDCLLHEGREVTKGEKWIIRSDLCVRR